MKTMLKYKYKGQTIEIALPEECGYKGFSVECTYRYDKKVEKYSLSMWLKWNDIGNKYKIESQEIDTQYIPGTRETIIENICTIVANASSVGYFDFFIQRYEDEMRSFERGEELFEKERLGIQDDI